MDSMMRWTRRRFLGAAAAGGAMAGAPGSAAWGVLVGQAAPRSQAGSPEIISGQLQPLMESNVARPLRYQPEKGGFVVRNGREFFNRPLYGANVPFRADGGDLPEFSLYLPGHGGNLRLAVQAGEQSKAKWLHECQSVTMRYLEGRLHYEVRDGELGPQGVITVEALTAEAGLWVECVARDVAGNVSVLWAFGGVSGRKGKRNGDIGCEVEPVSRFFQLRPEECNGNEWTLPVGRAGVAEVRSGKFRLAVEASAEAEWKLGRADAWNEGWSALWASNEASPKQPVLLGRTVIAKRPAQLGVRVLEGAVQPAADGASGRVDAKAFAARRDEVRDVSRRVRWSTPDAYFNSVGTALATAADAIWDEQQGCVMHGAVAWRVPLAGWRGPYCLDALGDHARMQRHLRHWITRQNVSAVSNGASGEASPTGFAGVRAATGAPDAGSHLSRSENLLHSNGDLGHNHYDMNLVFFDALLRHLRWTGDVAFAREVWPTLERHAAWERRLFRREYGTAAKSAPLYEAYAAIWASDNLQYSGGGAAHSSAYNVFLNRGMAEIAHQLGMRAEVVHAYRGEADAIAAAMREHLWMRDRGAFAESREWLGERCLGEDPAVWTVYHTIDSEVTNAREAWQMVADRLRAIRRVPVRGEGVPADAGWQLACSDWHPYVWSLTLLVLAENLAFALAMYQAGMADEAWQLLRGNLMDAGFRGLCPGNFPMSLQLDPHRQESQRDFGDPIGCASRAIVEGLWGVQPRVLEGRLELRPQLPREWESATFEHPEIAVAFEREGQLDRWTITPRLARPVTLDLQLRARTVELPVVTVNGQRVEAQFVPDAIGGPRLRVGTLGKAPAWKIEIQWHGEAAQSTPPQPLRVSEGEAVRWPEHLHAAKVEDPQGALEDGRFVRAGGNTVFLLQRHGACEYWLPVDVQVEAKSLEPAASTNGRCEPVPLDGIFNGRVRDILSRGYVKPRPEFCSLNLPDTLLGGWANFDSHALIDDAGLSASGNVLRIGDAIVFAAASTSRNNCCYVSQWSMDQPRVTEVLRGHARRVHLLLAGTTFPQATRSCHAEVTVHYADRSAQKFELRSPNTWWPVEQDYLLDDYIFRLDPAPPVGVSVDWRLDLETGRARRIDVEQMRGKARGPIQGGSGFVVSLDTDPKRELTGVELHTRLWGVVLAWMGLTVERES